MGKKLFWTLFLASCYKPTVKIIILVKNKTESVAFASQNLIVTLPQTELMDFNVNKSMLSASNSTVGNPAEANNMSADEIEPVTPVGVRASSLSNLANERQLLLKE